MIMIDGWGYTGLIVDYAMIVFFTLSALLIFLYCWWNKRLDFDEIPKYQMLEEESPYE